MLQQLLILMTHKSVTDGGVKMLKLASLEFFFTANMVGNLIALMKDSVSRAEVACALRQSPSQSNRCSWVMALF